MNQIARTWYEEWANFFVSQENRLRPGHMSKICSNENFLPEFFYRFKKIWDWSYLSSNPNLTLSFITKHLDKNWNWFKLSKNPVITSKFIDMHPTLPWSYEELSCNPSIYNDLSFIERNLCKLNQRELMRSAPVHFLLKMNLDYFLEHKFWDCISANPTLDPSFLMKNLDKSWNWVSLSFNPAMTMSFISDHLLLPWCWEFVGTRVTSEFLISHPDFEWDWMFLSKNPNILPAVRQHPEWPWSWALLSSNKSLTINDVLAFPNQSWAWDSISRILPVNDIINHPQLSWFELARNQSVGIPFVQSTMHQPWFLDLLASNEMKQVREEYIVTKTKEWLKKAREEIEQELYQVAWHPDRLKWVMDEEQKEQWKIC